MLPKSAVRKFLYRERDDHRAAKAGPEDKLLRIVQGLPARPIIWHGLRRPQKVCFVIGANQPRFAFILDTGVGKTLLAVLLARYYAALGKVHKALVLVPARINKDEWARQIQKHSPWTSYTILSGSSEEKWAQVESSDSLLYVTTYMGFARMVTKLVKKERGRGRKLALSDPLIRKAQKTFDGLFLDESHHVSNEKALFYRIAHQVSKRRYQTEGGAWNRPGDCNIVYLMTGTPFGRDPAETWAQIQLVDDGHSLGETKGLFHEAFSKKKENAFGSEWEFDRSKEGMLHDFLAHRSIRYEADQSDLPRVNRIMRVVRLPAEAAAYYERAKQAIRDARGNFRACENAFIRMRQISSGFLGAIDDETGERAQVVFAENPKLEMLHADLDSIVRNYKAVVFFDFTYSGLRISRELDHLGIGNRLIYGATRDTATPLHDFDHDDDCRVMVLSNKMVEGLNLQVAKYGLFYESPVGVKGRKQAERRVERQESAHDVVFLEDLVTDGTADHAILAFHRQGRDLFKAIIEGETEFII